MEISSGESVWAEFSGNEEEPHSCQPEQKCVDEYVILKYEGKYFAGVIFSVAEEGATVSHMAPCGRL